MKKITEKINKKIQELLNNYKNLNDAEFEKMYRVYGDIEDAEYSDDKTLHIYFISKGYNDEGSYNGTIPIFSDEEYNKEKPKESYNRFRDEWSWSYPTLEFAANSLVRFINDQGAKVKKIVYTEWRD